MASQADVNDRNFGLAADAAQCSAAARDHDHTQRPRSHPAKRESVHHFRPNEGKTPPQGSHGETHKSMHTHCVA